MRHFDGFLKTPPLWINEQFGIKQFEFPSIDLSGFVPEPIPQNIRLGHQVEHVFHQLIEYDSTYEVLAYNQQLKRNKITLGELDFILKHKQTGKLKHVELTYKFYILDPSITEPIHRAMDPNRKDMFFTKMEKTKNNQFSLLHSSEGVQLMEQLGIANETIDQECCFLGQLFVPYQHKQISIRPLNPKCIIGYWLNLKSLMEQNFRNCEFYILRKYQWLHTPHLDVNWQTHQEALLDIHVKHLSQNAPMIWIKNTNNTIEKCFVVWW